jgi:hypothetical protein
MSEKTAPALAKLDTLLPMLKEITDGGKLFEEASALRRAVAAFHMEAIRFRMFSVERMLKHNGDASTLRVFEELRHELETAGFHTRSHAAPGS